MSLGSDRNGLVWSVVFVLTILDIAVPLSLGLSIPGPETLARFYNICLQPTTAIDD
ncbi:transposase-like protein, partial [Pyrenophora tritici-repentis]